MEKAKFTIKDIKNYIEEKTGLVWKDNLVYDITSGSYTKAIMEYFRTHQNLAFLYLSNPKDKLGYLVKMQISNDRFVIWEGRTPIDVSRDWVNMLTSVQGVTV